MFIASPIGKASKAARHFESVRAARIDTASSGGVAGLLARLRRSTPRAIAKELGCARNTVRRYLREEGARRFGPPDRRRCKLDAFRVYLRERVARARPRWIPAIVLLREIAQRGYTGGISQLKVFLAPLKVVQAGPRWCVSRPSPGQQMQATFTVVRRGPSCWWRWWPHSAAAERAP